MKMRGSIPAPIPRVNLEEYRKQKAEKRAQKNSTSERAPDGGLEAGIVLRPELAVAYEVPQQEGDE